MIIRIMLTVFVVLIVALSITYFTNDLYNPDIELSQAEKLSYYQKFEPEQKKIFIIGSSHAFRINATIIENNISQTYQDYEIYNLAHGGDTPSKRIEHLQKMIESKPVLVVYGVTFRDFIGKLPQVPIADVNRTVNQVPIADVNRTVNQVPIADVNRTVNQVPITDVIGTNKPVEALLPEPWVFLYKWIPNNVEIDFTNFDNPQRTTFRILAMLQSGNNPKVTLLDLENTPFRKYLPKVHIIQNEKYLKQNLEKRMMTNSLFSGYTSDANDHSNEDLKKIILELKKNDIEVILFSTPLSRIYLDKIDSDDIEIFKEVLQNISNEFDVKIYHFYDKYADLNVWTDISHVSTHQKASIYSTDIANIILNEINP